MLSESTSLIPLTQLHQESPSSPHYLRTRAITRSLKGDFLPAIKDLTAALSLVKALAEHQSQPDTNGKGKQTSKGSDLSPDMESQCVFQRGGCYLTLAIRHAGRVTKIIQKAIPQPGSEEFVQSESDIRSLRIYARKAERDFLRFLSKVDYSPDVDREEGAVVVTLNTLFAHEGETQSGESSNKVLAVVQTMTNGEQDEVPEAALTYHPLLPDALYSLLLAHTLTLTPPQVSSSTSSECRQKEKAELIRWARTVARLQSICDGYPLFLPARSPYLPSPNPRQTTLTLVLVRTGLNSYVCLAKHSFRSPTGKQLFRLYLVLQLNVNLLFLPCVIFLSRQNRSLPREVCQSRITRSRRNGLA